MDHAEMGARLLDSWRLPEEIVEAIRFHHRPAKSGSAGTATLYAAEFSLESDEDRPSLRQLRAGRSPIDIRLDELSQFSALDPAVGALMKIA